MFDDMAGQQAYFTFQHKWLILTDAHLHQTLSVDEHIHNISNVAFILFDWENAMVSRVEQSLADVVGRVTAFVLGKS